VSAILLWRHGKLHVIVRECIAHTANDQSQINIHPLIFQAGGQLNSERIAHLLLGAVELDRTLLLVLRRGALLVSALLAAPCCEDTF